MGEVHWVEEVSLAGWERFHWVEEVHWPGEGWLVWFPFEGCCFTGCVISYEKDQFEKSKCEMDIWLPGWCGFTRVRPRSISTPYSIGIARLRLVQTQPRPQPQLAR